LLSTEAQRFDSGRNVWEGMIPVIILRGKRQKGEASRLCGLTPETKKREKGIKNNYNPDSLEKKESLGKVGSGAGERHMFSPWGMGFGIAPCKARKKNVRRKGSETRFPVGRQLSFSGEERKIVEEERETCLRSLGRKREFRKVEVGLQRPDAGKGEIIGSEKGRGEEKKFIGEGKKVILSSGKERQYKGETNTLF